MSEDRGFEVVDKRHGREEAAEPSIDELLSGAAAAGADEEPPVVNPFPEITVTGVLDMSIGLLSDLAWVCLGLSPNPRTGKIEPDLAQARRAIDTLADLIKHADPDLTPTDRRELGHRLTDLRMNYVRQSGK